VLRQTLRARKTAWSSLTAEKSTSPLCFIGPWHLKQWDSSIGRTSLAKLPGVVAPAGPRKKGPRYKARAAARMTERAVLLGKVNGRCVFVSTAMTILADRTHTVGMTGN